MYSFLNLTSAKYSESVKYLQNYVFLKFKIISLPFRTIPPHRLSPFLDHPLSPAVFLYASFSPSVFPLTPSFSPSPVSPPLSLLSACLTLGQRCPCAAGSGRNDFNESETEMDTTDVMRTSEPKSFSLVWDAWRGQTLGVLNMHVLDEHSTC